MNNWRYGLSGYYANVAADFGVRPVLYARLAGTNVLLTNLPLFTSIATKPYFEITGDDRVDFTYKEIGWLPSNLHFPYGFAVEPDQPP